MLKTNYQTLHSPDVLDCLANLSSDEIFTPPKVARQMLDLLPEELWSDPEAKFLDPATKSGVFLREIAKRLLKGLESQIPDLQERIDHIYQKQLYGVAITELTDLLTKRSLYCTKYPSGRYSVSQFPKERANGNIYYKNIRHVWKDGRCQYCGASQNEYDRDPELESHAYAFIHRDNPEELFNMRFDVIIGNPPYHMSDAGHGRSARPIYHLFIEQAKKLNPRFLSMIIPARWYAGGKGLDQFRQDMLADSRMKILVDFPDSTEPFPGVDIAGGICYFLWERGFEGKCTVKNIHRGKEVLSVRPLNEFSTFVRHATAVSIIKKINKMSNTMMNTVVSSRKPFGLGTNFKPLGKGELILRRNDGTVNMPLSEVISGLELVDKWKVITSKTSYDHGGLPDKAGQRRVFSIIDILPPNHVCTETYIVVQSFESELEAQNLISYLKTKLVRFLVAQLSFSQDITKDRFSFVPLQDFSKSWTDEELYAKYGLTEDEIDFIESMIKPMDLEES